MFAALVDMDSILAEVLRFAREAHGDQQRKFTPEPYIAHPIRVMEICSQFSNDIPLLAAALLHDVLEDTERTKTDLRDFLSTMMDAEMTNETMLLVEQLTDKYTKKNYPHWNRRKRKGKEALRLGKTSPAAQTIKYADIIDNSMHLEGAEKDFARKFLFEGRNLLRNMRDGNLRLHEKAVRTTEQCLASLH